MSDPSNEQTLEEGPHEGDLFREPVGLVSIGVFVLSLVLLALIPVATAPQPAGKAWFLSPRNMPMIGIALMLLPSGILSLGFFRDRAAARDLELIPRACF